MALSLDEGGLSWMRPVKEPRERGTVMAPPAAPTGDESVWRPGSGFRNTGAFRERAMQGAQLAARGAEMGEPTSYGGGAGAPEPIAVMRGGATTFSPGRIPGRQFVEPEMATPTQAQQAWNRASEVGEWRMPGQTLKEATPGEPAGAAQERMMRGELFQTQKEKTKREEADVVAKKTTETFDRLMNESPYSTFDTATNRTVFKAKNESEYRDYLAGKGVALKLGDPDAGSKHFNERQAARTWLQTQPLPENFNVDAYLGAVSQDPAAWAELTKKVGTAKISPGPVKKQSWWGTPTQREGPLRPAFQMPTEMETVPPM